MQVARKKSVADRGAEESGAGRFLTWRERLTAEFERQIHALQIEQQEREFFATSHGCDYDLTCEETVIAYQSARAEG